jgi:WD40 repeat protein
VCGSGLRSLDENEPLHRFQDMVTREPWKACSFSSHGDYVVAGSAQDTQHRLHLWDRHTGTFLRTLDGGKTGILDIAWHPTRPVIVTISTAGEIHVWAVNPNVRLRAGGFVCFFMAREGLQVASG